MFRRAALVPLALVVVAFLPAPVRACFCGPVERILEFPHVALEGRLVEIRLGRDWEAGPTDSPGPRSLRVHHREHELREVRYSIWVIEVEATFGSDLPARVELINAWSSCQAPDRRVGTRLFVMPRRDDEGQLHVDTCVPMLDLEWVGTLGTTLTTMAEDAPLRVLLEPLVSERDDTPLQRLWEERRRVAGLDPE